MTTELALWRAVFLDGLKLSVGDGTGSRLERAAALDWIASDGADVGTFVWCCELQQLDPSAVRRRIATLRAQRAARINADERKAA